MYKVDDMLFNEKQFHEMYVHQTLNRSGIMGNYYRWPGGILYYKIDGIFEQWEILTVI